MSACGPDASRAERTAAKKAAKEAKKLKASVKAAAALAAPRQQKPRIAVEVPVAAATPAGEKKDISQEAPKAYHPAYVEAAWYEWWAKSGFFKPSMECNAQPFVMVLPPPNVTGALHIGHALTNSVQDAIARWQRMRGRNVLWVPGTDHAGIATQTVVEKQLLRERGLTRHAIGRDGFVLEVEDYVRRLGSRIGSQQRRMGISVDWDREFFTLDGNLSAAVAEAFVRFHEQGLVYRGNRLVNWCCKLKTVISDIEVDKVEVEGATLLDVPGYVDPVEFGVIVSFAYQIEGGDGEIVVATTRVETMLGDVAVAVHSADARYARHHGKYVVHPVSGRRLPVLCDDELVDPAFGTGAVKITPAHDLDDYKCATRHGLEAINILDDDGVINENGGPFQGQPRFLARNAVVAFLQGRGLYRGKVGHKMVIPLCSRSRDVIEPVLKPQWWLNCRDMAAGACSAVDDSSLEIIPADFKPAWFRWLQDCEDWCVSRQLWWGHRIPAYYVVLAGETRGRSEDPGRWVVGRDEADARAAAAARFPEQSFSLEQDEDVLDTWFSSSILPFSVFGWPNHTADLDKFYPTSLLETGRDILFFWVARMVMMGIALTGRVPFSRVYLHAMVRDAHGRKMSKSLGNVIDPIHVIDGVALEELHAALEHGNLDVKELQKARRGQTLDFPNGIEECGTDALRFALCAYTAQGSDINLDIKRVVAYRHWCNKLWNAVRFATLHLGAGFTPVAITDVAALPFACRWILARLRATAATANAAMEALDLAAATQAIHTYWKYDVCDYFIELIKPVVDGGGAAAGQCRQTLHAALEGGLRLLHPFMPFITEELWQRMPRSPAETAPSIMLSAYPTAEDVCAADPVLSEMEYLQSVIKAARSHRTALGLDPKMRPTLLVSCQDEACRSVLEVNTMALSTMTGCDLAQDATAPSTGTSADVGCHTRIYIL